MKEFWNYTSICMLPTKIECQCFNFFLSTASLLPHIWHKTGPANGLTVNVASIIVPDIHSNHHTVQLIIGNRVKWLKKKKKLKKERARHNYDLLGLLNLQNHDEWILLIHIILSHTLSTNQILPANVNQLAIHKMAMLCHILWDNRVFSAHKASKFS